jgi:hypothetical protein
VPSSDVDSALVWVGPEHDEGAAGYTRSLAARVLDGLGRAGFPADEHGAVATNPLFARSYEAWAAAARSWLRDPAQEKAPILVSLVVDARPVWGVRPPRPSRTSSARPAATPTCCVCSGATPWPTGRRRVSCATSSWSTAVRGAAGSTSSAVAPARSRTWPAGPAWPPG